MGERGLGSEGGTGSMRDPASTQTRADDGKRLTALYVLVASRREVGERGSEGREGGIGSCGIGPLPDDGKRLTALYVLVASRREEGERGLGREGGERLMRDRTLPDLRHTPK